ncbi:hypothetical protein MRX96_033776 [Rhipicephalus microplus]
MDIDEKKPQPEPKGEAKSKSIGFFKQAKKSYLMFPVKEEKIKWDDYGEIIRPEDFIIIDKTAQEEETDETKAEDDDLMQGEYLSTLSQLLQHEIGKHCWPI